MSTVEKDCPWGSHTQVMVGNRPGPFVTPAWLSVLGLLLALLSAGPVSARDDGFSEDADAAVRQASEQGKDLLLLFTGSDWCPPCKRLEQEILSEAEFLDQISKAFVLVKFDFPRSTPQDPEIAKQNKEWAEKFGVASFPTVVLADATLKPFAFKGYQEGGVANYLAMLDSSRQLRVDRDRLLASAKDAQGPDRAKLLDEALGGMGDDVARVYYPELIEEIVSLDNDNALGLRAKWNAAADAEMRKIVMTDLLMMARIGKPESAIQLIDDVLKEIDFTGSEKLAILQMKLNLVRQLDDAEQMDAVLDAMISLDGVEGDTKQRLIAKKIMLMVGSGRQDEAMQLLDKTLVGNSESGYLFLTKGELHSARKEYEAAVTAYDAGLTSNVNNPDLMVDLTSARADALFSLNRQELALQTLDDFASNDRYPADLRAEVLLHKAMMMRDMDRSRQAMLAENRAIEITESADERAAIQQIVQRMRKKYEK